MAQQHTPGFPAADPITTECGCRVIQVQGYGARIQHCTKHVLAFASHQALVDALKQYLDGDHADKCKLKSLLIGECPCSLRFDKRARAALKLAGEV